MATISIQPCCRGQAWLLGRARCHVWPNSLLVSRGRSRTLASAQDSYHARRDSFANEIKVLPEHQAAVRLQIFLENKVGGITQSFDQPVAIPPPPPEGYQHLMNQNQIKNTITAAMTTFALHVESRVASMIGEGFYTIGPCGEEALSSIGCAVQPQDSVALHYRHLGVNIARQLEHGENLDQLILDRARGYTVSRYDPVTGGVHCSIGSDPSRHQAISMQPGAGDFIVTSTLASQCPSAVGRALGYSLAAATTNATAMTKQRPVSFVTLGDGSVHNHHFWSAFHLARHARHKKVKCPVAFGVSDNGLSISYKTGGYVDTIFDQDRLVPLYRVNGNDMMHVYSQTKAALSYARKQSAPVVLLYQNLVRRFGHAASDRQSAYLDYETIAAMADNMVLESAIQQAVEVYNVGSYTEMLDQLQHIRNFTQQSFAQASNEPKVTRQDMLERVLQPSPFDTQAEVHFHGGANPTGSRINTDSQNSDSFPKPEVMRKHMTRVINEAMKIDPKLVYLGEDVRHGGYYVVTEGLAQSFPDRVLDFPPDETSLLGAGMGFAQVGLIPIVEIPYAKYLDCGADMFYEIAIAGWLSNNKRPNGMIVRLQGFDRGLFGGNFHTTNILPHVPPGVDLVCYSNGSDYVRGFRNAVIQAEKGHVVVLVDCTNLLNLRHLHDRDRGWERVYPVRDDNGTMSFDEIQRYGNTGKACIVTYGNGVVSALQARRQMAEKGIITGEDQVDVIDSPLLSSVPEGLKRVIPQYHQVLFADICKEGPGGGVLSGIVCSLQSQKILPSRWGIVAAPRTYNPLGSMCTFLNSEDITDAFALLSNEA